MKSSATLLGASILPQALASRSFAQNDETLKVGLVGCGGRGRGAAVQALSTEGPVKLVAMGDAFSNNLEDAYKSIQKQKADRVDVKDDMKFTGFDAYKKVIDSGVDVVILTTPPGFRPQHFKYAVSQNKNVFMEKPVAVDPTGIREVLAAAQVAKEKNLKVGVGLQRHHSAKYQETVRRIQDGALGNPILIRVYWNGAGVWVRPRQPDMTEMEYQMRNWYYFNWLCGDHIVEQHIHNLDVANWIMGDFPASAQGQGGRQVRTGIDHGEIFDHHMIEYTYPNGTKMLSQCRHIPGCWSSVSEHVHGDKGTSNVGAGRIEAGEDLWRFRGESKNAYQVEHDRLFAAIRNNTPHNEAEYGAKSTMTAILGRLTTYSGKVISWDDAMKSEVSLAPSLFDWKADPPILPDENGRYPIPIPGVTQVI